MKPAPGIQSPLRSAGLRPGVVTACPARRAAIPAPRRAGGRRSNRPAQAYDGRAKAPAEPPRYGMPADPGLFHRPNFESQPGALSHDPSPTAPQERSPYHGSAFQSGGPHGGRFSGRVSADQKHVLRLPFVPGRMIRGQNIRTIRVGFAHDGRAKAPAEPPRYGMPADPGLFHRPNFELQPGALFQDRRQRLRGSVRPTRRGHSYAACEMPLFACGKLQEAGAPLSDGSERNAALLCSGQFDGLQKTGRKPVATGDRHE